MIERTPLPAASQTPPLLPILSRSTSLAPPVRYWMREAPSRPAAVGHAAGARRRSRVAAAVLRHRHQALLPLHRALAIEHSSLHAGELPALAEVDDACAPLDLDPSVAYRFGAVK
jgi:hypothetical protein